jgi:hypothetical protein
LKMHLGDKTRLILAAIVVAIVFVGGIMLFAEFVPVQHRIQTKWVRFLFVSVLFVSVGFVGYAIRAYWKLRRSLIFWSVFLGFLVIHLLGIGYFFYVGSGLPLLVFGPVCAVELMGMGFVIYWILGVGPGKVSMNL